jgi:hypothetical protein
VPFELFTRELPVDERKEVYPFASKGFQRTTVTLFGLGGYFPRFFLLDGVPLARAV